MVTKDKFQQMINEIGTTDDDVRRRELLDNFRNELDTIIDEANANAEQVLAYEQDNENLRKANMKLFLQVGEYKTPKETLEEETGRREEEEKPKRKFEDLFKEGRLK